LLQTVCPNKGTWFGWIFFFFSGMKACCHVSNSVQSLASSHAGWIPMLTNCTSVLIALSQVVHGPQGLLQWLGSWKDAPMTQRWQLSWLPVLSNVAPPALRHKAATENMLQIMEVHQNWPVYADVFEHPPPRLASRLPIWAYAQMPNRMPQQNLTSRHCTKCYDIWYTQWTKTWQGTPTTSKIIKHNVKIWRCTASTKNITHMKCKLQNVSSICRTTQQKQTDQ